MLDFDLKHLQLRVVGQIPVVNLKKYRFLKKVTISPQNPASGSQNPTHVLTDAIVSAMKF